MRAGCFADLNLLWSPSPFWLDGITVKAGQLEGLDPFFLEINRAKGRAFCVLLELEVSHRKDQKSSAELLLKQ